MVIGNSILLVNLCQDVEAVPGTFWPAAWLPAARPVSCSWPGAAHPARWGLRRAWQAQDGTLHEHATSQVMQTYSQRSMGNQRTAAPAAAVRGVGCLDGQLLLPFHFQASLSEGWVEPVVVDPCVSETC